MRIEVILPDNCINKYTEDDVKIVIASALYDKGVVALGYAAESVGLDKRTLIENMGKYDVPVLNLSKYDVNKVIENAKRRANARR